MICSNIITCIRTWCYSLKKWKSPHIKAPDPQKQLNSDALHRSVGRSVTIQLCYGTQSLGFKERESGVSVNSHEKHPFLLKLICTKTLGIRKY